MDHTSWKFGLIAILLIPAGVFGGQTPRPDLSGTWLLDRGISDLKSPPIAADQPRGVSGRAGGRVSGNRAGSGGGMGGGGMHGGGRSSAGQSGGQATGGSISHGSPAPLKLDLDFYQIGEIADQLTVEHRDPAITIKPSEKGDGSALPVLSYMADGKSHETPMADGGSVKSKTSWQGVRLVTKSTEKSEFGSMEIVEERSLSDDGNTLIVSVTYKGSASHWTEQAVYRRAKAVINSGTTAQ